MRPPESTLPAAAVAVFVLSLLAAFPHPGWADPCSGGGHIRDGGGEAVGVCPGDDGDESDGGTAQRVSGGAAVTEAGCTPERAADPAWWWLSFVPEQAVPGTYRVQQEHNVLVPPDGYVLAVYRDCNGELRSDLMWVPEPEAGSAADVEGVFAARQQARARVEPRVPQVHVSPEQAVVRFPTWLWLEESYWQPRAATSATPSGVAVGVRARPVRAEWDLGDGVKVCDGPGIPWSQAAQDVYDAQSETTRGDGDPACTFTFLNASSTRPSGVFDASVSVVWEFSWSLGGVERGVFGSVRVVERWPLTVGEVQTVITG
jgi:hypothetical protein